MLYRRFGRTEIEMPVLSYAGYLPFGLECARAKPLSNYGQAAKGLS